VLSVHGAFELQRGRERERGEGRGEHGGGSGARRKRRRFGHVWSRHRKLLWLRPPAERWVTGSAEK
jgi:hypothetical protein